MGVIGNFIRAMFGMAPRHHTSAYGELYAAVVRRLSRPGVRVGRGADMPRVEVYGITEGERMDKEGALRELAITVESISNTSLPDAIAMNEENLALLTGGKLELAEGWDCVGFVPEQLQDLSEVTDSQKIVYRIIQSFRCYVERVKTIEQQP